MSRPSTIKRLPPEIKKELDRLLESGVPIHEIRSSLQNIGTTPPSKSAIGRYKQNFDQQMQRLRLSRELASTWVRNFQDDPGGEAAKLTVETLENLAMHASSALLEDGGEIDTGGLAVLARAAKDLSLARRTIVDAEEKVRAKILKETSEKMDRVIQSQGLSTDVAAAIREAMTQ
ncbi:MAG: DUF3486 family protein [Magnetococcales bacterium]|nr:DUF3486 family protein [Magnetococcales bacterium]